MQAYTPVLVCDVVRLGYRFSVFMMRIYLVIYESNNTLSVALYYKKKKTTATI